jgi:arylformamidase
MESPAGRGSAELIDISVLLREGTPEWPGDTPYACTWTWRQAAGDSVNVSSVTASPHVGTHADAPLHVADGWPGSHDLPLDAFVGPARVVHVSAPPGPVDVTALGLPPEGIAGGRLLLRTGCSIAGGAFPGAWPFLSEPCARTLLDGGLRLLGVDAPSVDARDSKSLAVHRLLFEGGACVVENLDLRHVPDGVYELIAAPLRLHMLDAAPLRALLRPLPG